MLAINEERSTEGVDGKGACWSMVSVWPLWFLSSMSDGLTGPRGVFKGLEKVEDVKGKIVF